MDASSCVGRYDGQYHKGVIHGNGAFTSAQGGWTYSGALERERPTVGELVDTDGRRVKVTYAKGCGLIFNNLKPQTKVRVVCCAAEQDKERIKTEIHNAKLDEELASNDDNDGFQTVWRDAAADWTKLKHVTEPNKLQL
jgi:hypothetical protein